MTNTATFHLDGRTDVGPMSIITASVNGQDIVITPMGTHVDISMNDGHNDKRLGREGMAFITWLVEVL
jgi:hypothetical protein